PRRGRRVRRIQPERSTREGFGISFARCDLCLHRAQSLGRAPHAGTSVPEIRLLARPALSVVSTDRRRGSLHSTSTARTLPVRASGSARSHPQCDRDRNALGLHESKSFLPLVSCELRHDTERGNRASARAAQLPRRIDSPTVFTSARFPSLAPPALAHRL